MTLINWLLAATGFTGAITLMFLLHRLRRLFTGAPPSVEVFFSPKGGCTEAVVREITAARHEVLVQNLFVQLQTDCRGACRRQDARRPCDDASG